MVTLQNANSKEMMSSDTSEGTYSEAALKPHLWCSRWVGLTEPLCPFYKGRRGSETRGLCSVAQL